MFAIGDRVTAAGFGAGYVHDISGAPGGDHSYHVRAPDGPHAVKGGTFRTGELSAAPEIPAEYEIGQRVRLFGSEGTVIDRAGDTYAVEIVLARPSGLVFRHVYPAVPDWMLALGWGSP